MVKYNDDFNKNVDLENSISEIDYYEVAEAQFELDKYVEAIQNYDKAIQLDPKWEFAYIGRGKCKFELGRFFEAIQDYDKAIKLDPSYDDTYELRGDAKVELGQYTEAIKDYEKAYSLDSYSLFDTHKIYEIENLIDEVEYDKKANIENITAEDYYNRAFKNFEMFLIFYN
jgi:tetratricopeptide (TPR) repeat protein